MPARLIQSTKLVFEDGAFFVRNIEPPEVVPADPLEYPPTRFVYAEHVVVELFAGFDNQAYAEALFMRGGGPCKLVKGEIESPFELTFSATDWDVSITPASRSIDGTLTGLLSGMYKVGQPVPDELNAYYADLNKPRELTPEEQAEREFWSDECWDE